MKQRGFTLIELMIVVTIIGLLVALAAPAFQQFAIRSRIIEGINIAQGAKTLLATDGIASLADLQQAADTWNAQAAGTGANSKYVSSVQINPATGFIEVTLNSLAVGLGISGNILYISPYIRSAAGVEPLLTAINNGNSGTIDWACSSTTQIIANSKGMLNAPIGTLQANYAPKDCR